MIELERNPKRAARRATLTVRAMQVTIEVLRHHQQPKQCQFHYTLKSGCHIEQLQLETAGRLLNALKFLQAFMEDQKEMICGGLSVNWRLIRRTTGNVL